MLKYCFLFFIFFLNLQFSFGQNPKTLKISVYFDTDKFAIRSSEKETIDKTLDTLPVSEIAEIFVIGNTDNKADSLYNLNLSNNRSRAVKNYLIQKGLDSNLIATSYLGMNAPISSNETEAGKQKNRRVDITFVYKPKPQKPKIPKTQPKISRKKPPLINQDSLLKAQADSIQSAKQDSIAQTLLADTCRGKDTIITLPEGTKLVFNRCEYLELKDCLVLTEANTSSSIRNNDLQLEDELGAPLVSCGMLNVQIKPECNKKKNCFTTPIKVRFPLPPPPASKTEPNCNYCNRNAQLWAMNGDGSWGDPKNMKIVYVDKQAFYQYEIRCPSGWQNCDCRINGTAAILKIKTKRAYKLIEANLFSNCPKTSIKFTPKRRHHVAKRKIPCTFPMDSITAKVVDKQGDTLYLKPTPVMTIRRKLRFSKCRQEFIFFAYRKLVIDPKLFEKKALK